MRAPILIYGPTASGKSSLALELARQMDAVIVNSDALQVYSNWRVLSARPDEQDQANAPHYLYGHVAPDVSYSVGQWLKELRDLLDSLAKRAIIVGGTGLYLTALTEGLADIPATPADVRDAGNALRLTEGADGFVARLKLLDPEILERTDQQNPMRLQRAWEVVTATGKPLSAWQAETGPPLIAQKDAHLICLNAPADWQRARIDARFEEMVLGGAIEECAAALKAGWHKERPSSQAIGARQLISYLKGEMSLEDATDVAKTATHQFAKRQRTWAKNRMKSWDWFDADGPDAAAQILEHIENSDRLRLKNS